jgi:hypothetical protein
MIEGFISPPGTHPDPNEELHNWVLHQTSFSCESCVSLLTYTIQSIRVIVGACVQITQHMRRSWTNCGNKHGSEQAKNIYYFSCQVKQNPIPTLFNHLGDLWEGWFILDVTKGRLHLQSDGLYFEGGVFSCPFAVPVVTEPAPDLVEPFCCTLDFGFRILLRDRGNIGPSFSDVNRTIIPTTISVLQTHHTNI